MSLQQSSNGTRELNLLVNNAGIPGRRDFLTVEPELVERVVRTNYLGGLWCLRAFLPGLEAAAPEAHVVNIVSVAGAVAFPPSGPYSASKHAQLAFSRATSAQLRARGIHGLTVMPGSSRPRASRRRPRCRARSSGEWSRPRRSSPTGSCTRSSRRPELTYPRFYRTFGVAQALAPGLLGRFASRSRSGYRSTKPS